MVQLSLHRGTTRKLYVTTKLDTLSHGKLFAIHVESLKKLQISKRELDFDPLTIQFTVPGQLRGYETDGQVKEEGLAKTIGSANFRVEI